MKTYILVALMSLPMVALASGNSNSDKGPKVSKKQVQKAMKKYVQSIVSKNGYLPVIHEGKVIKLKVKKSEKYPDGFHAGVKSHGNLHTSCADFTDESGKTYDIDFLVSRVNRGYKVVQPIVHSIDGVKSKYDLAH